jgi:hypothetical protein
MVRDFNDSLVSICPENSYFWISEGMYEIVWNCYFKCENIKLNFWSCLTPIYVLNRILK